MKISNKNILLVVLISFLLPAVASAQNIKDLKIGIVHSEKSIQLLHKNDQNYLPIQDWEILFLNNKISYSIFYDEDLDDNNFGDMDVLILPSVEVLSDNAAENLLTYLEDGKGLLILGELGNYNSNGLLRTTNTLDDLFGISTNKINIEKNKIVTHSIIKSDQVSHHIQINSKLMLSNSYPVYYAANKTRGFKSLGYYEKSISPISGILKSERENGRVMWFGFQLNQIIGGMLVTDIQNLVFNSIAFLADKPNVWMNRWPDNYNYCTLFISAGSTNLNVLKNNFGFAADKFVVNYFFTPEDIQQYLTEISYAPSEASINVLFDNYENLSLSETDKLSLFDETIFNVNSVIENQSPGMMLLNDYSWAAKIEVLEKLGYEFLLYDNKIFNLNRTNNLTGQDENVIVPVYYKIDLNSEYQNKIKQLSDDGSEINLIELVIPESEPEDDLLEYKIKKFTSTVISDENWVTDFSQLLNWLEFKGNIFYEIIDEPDQNLFILSIDNDNTSPIEDIIFHLSLPSYIQSLSVLNQNTDIRLNYATGDYDLRIKRLNPTEKLKIKINYLEKK